MTREEFIRKKHRMQGQMARLAVISNHLQDLSEEHTELEGAIDLVNATGRKLEQEFDKLMEQNPRTTLTSNPLITLANADEGEG